MPYLRTILKPDSAGRLKAIIAADGVLVIGGGPLTYEQYAVRFSRLERVEIRLPAVTLAELAAVLDEPQEAKRPGVPAGVTTR